MMKLAFVVVALFLSCVAAAQTTRPAQKAEQFKTQVTIDVDLNHLVYLPADYG